MPFVPLSKNQTRNAVIQIRGPRSKKEQRRLKKELTAVLKKHHGAKFKKREA
jgi:hypothetical protein